MQLAAQVGFNNLMPAVILQLSPLLTRIHFFIQYYFKLAGGNKAAADDAAAFCFNCTVFRDYFTFRPLYLNTGSAVIFSLLIGY